MNVNSSIRLTDDLERQLLAVALEERPARGHGGVPLLLDEGPQRGAAGALTGPAQVAAPGAVVQAFIAGIERVGQRGAEREGSHGQP